MEVLGDLPLRVAYERLAGMVRMLGEDVHGHGPAQRLRH